MITDTYITNVVINVYPIVEMLFLVYVLLRPQREILQGGTRLLWCPELRSLSEFYIIIF